jgi:hypothetical protein
MFLWRHRVSTFQTLRARFFPSVKNETAYERLRRLRSGRYIQTVFLNGTNNLVWTLDKRGFEYLIERHLPQVSWKGFKPQSPYHDLLVMSALLGDWLNDVPQKATIVTEAEIRSIESEFLPERLREKAEHFPDGIWAFQKGSGHSGVALEVEITVKKFDRYLTTCSFYTSELFFDHVVWIVANSHHASLIHQASRKYGIPREGLNLFIGRQDFESKLWDARFLNQSMRDVTLAEFLGSKVGAEKSVGLPVSGTATTTQDSVKGERPPFLDFRINIERLKRYNQNPRPEIS